jgi:UDP-sugar transporter A1/2/3
MSDANFVYKFGSLATLVVQNVTVILLMKYTLANVAPEDKYLTSTAVVLSEIIKAIVSLGIVYSQAEFSMAQFKKTLFEGIVVDGRTTLKLAIPAGLYAMQNNIMYIALNNLDPATFQVTYQLKLFTTAIFSVIFLKRTLLKRQWLSLCVLMAGVATVQIQMHKQQAAKQAAEALRTFAEQTETHDDTNFTVGLIAVLVACCSSGFAGVYFELQLKGANASGIVASVWLRNIQLGIWGALFGSIYMFTYDGAVISEFGFTHNYNHLVWAVVFMQAGGGLIVAAVIKYADNILKGFAVSISLVLSCVGSAVFFDFIPTSQFVLGGFMVLVSVWIYSNGM